MEEQVQGPAPQCPCNKLNPPGKQVWRLDNAHISLISFFKIVNLTSKISIYFLKDVICLWLLF